MRSWSLNRQTDRAQLLRWVLLIALLIAAAIFGRDGFLDGAEDANGFVRGRARVVDGDSLTIGRARIRLEGVDAPEGPQTCTRDGREWDCGEESRRRLSDLIGGGAVSCRVRKRDQHDRGLAVCSTAANANLNRAMVESGFAVSYGEYRREEDAARNAKRGLWSGEFQRPRDWRREHGVAG